MASICASVSGSCVSRPPKAADPIAGIDVEVTNGIVKDPPGIGPFGDGAARCPALGDAGRSSGRFSGSFGVGIFHLWQCCGEPRARWLSEKTAGAVSSAARASPSPETDCRARCQPLSTSFYSTEVADATSPISSVSASF
jgi:hypothetical protein